MPLDLPQATRRTRASGHAAVPAPTASGPEERILVLQGGGALGAYQAGVFEALSHGALQPDWVAGISIGAINGALIAGNPAHLRIDRLRAFWETVSTPHPALWLPSLATLLAPRETAHGVHAGMAMWLGAPGFFTPWVPPAPLQLPGTPAAISCYDTAPLRQTLERLVDFDRIQAGGVRLSIGAVNVRTGNFQYFDSARQRLDARHIMASGALPPGFPPVEIDGEHYWDGGLVSNTPLQYVLDQAGTRDRVVFQVDLFPATGAMPATLAQAGEREKDIRYSSRTRLNTTNELDLQVIAQAAHRLLAKLPPHLRQDPDAQALARLRGRHAIDVVHLIYRSRREETLSKDYEFSRQSMREHWGTGHADMAHTLGDPRWNGRTRNPCGVRVFDLTADAPRNTFHRV